MFIFSSIPVRTVHSFSICMEYFNHCLSRDFPRITVSPSIRDRPFEIQGEGDFFSHNKLFFLSFCETSHFFSKVILKRFLNNTLK